MRTNLGLTVASIVVMLVTSGVAEAQVVSFTGSGYKQNPPPAKNTVAPYGTFSVPMNKAGSYRVVVDYGILDFGTFKAYAPGVNGIPSASASTALAVNAAGGTFNWSIAAQDGSGVTQETQARARLQRSTDGGTTWTYISGAESLLQALPSNDPGAG